MTESTTASKKVVEFENLGVGLQHSRQARVGIVVNEFCSAHYGRLLDGACKFLSSAGHFPVVQPSFMTSRGEFRALSNLFSSDCDGIIFNSDTLLDSEIQQLMSRHSELVLINRPVEGFENRCVYLDNKTGAQLAAQHLLDMGHTNVAMITGSRNKRYEVEARTNAFLREFDQQGYPVESELIVEGDFSYTGGMTNFRKLLRTQLAFTAVFAQNDRMAMGVIDVCRQKGLKVPEDLSVIGFDDDQQFCQYSEIGLTTVRQPNEEIGKRAAELLNEIIIGDRGAPALPANYGRIIPELIERDTVKLLVKPEVATDSILGKDLTKREIECLQWIAGGKTSGEIGIILSISESTVNFHLKNTLIKLNSTNRVQAVAKAVHSRLISP